MRRSIALLQSFKPRLYSDSCYWSSILSMASSSCTYLWRVKHVLVRCSRAMPISCNVWSYITPFARTPGVNTDYHSTSLDRRRQADSQAAHRKHESMKHTPIERTHGRSPGPERASTIASPSTYYEHFLAGNAIHHCFKVMEYYCTAQIAADSTVIWRCVGQRNLLRFR